MLYYELTTNYKSRIKLYIDYYITEKYDLFVHCMTQKEEEEQEEEEEEEEEKEEVDDNNDNDNNVNFVLI